MNRKKFKLKWQVKEGDSISGVMTCDHESQALNRINKQVNEGLHDDITLWRLEDRTGNITKTWKRGEGDKGMPESVVGTLK